MEEAEPADKAGPVEKFLDDAGLVLAQEHGLTVKARVLLQAAARERGLTDEQFSEAILRLQGGKREEAVDPKLAARRAAYESWVRSQFRKLPRGMLTPSLRERIIEAGHYQHELPLEECRQTVRQLAESLGVRNVSPEDARRHVSLLIEQVAGDAQWLDDESIRRLHSSGIEWGLSHDEIDKLLEDHLTVTSEREDQRQLWKAAAMAAAGSAAVVLVVFLGWGIFLGGLFSSAGSSPSDPPSGEKPIAENPVTRPVVAPAREDGWWDTELVGAMAAARSRAPAIAAQLVKLRESKGAARAEIYGQLLDAKEIETAELSRQSTLALVLAGCYALDPDEAAAARLRETLIKLIPERDGKAPLAFSDYKRGSWAATTLVALLSRNGLPPARKEALQSDFDSALGARLDLSGDAAARDRQALSLLYERLAARLVSVVAADPKDALNRYGEFVSHAASYLTKPQREKLDADYLTAALANPEVEWQKLEALFWRASHSSDPLNVLKILAIYEKTTDSELREQLEAFLLDRVEVTPASHAVEDVARAVRAGLGGSAEKVASADRKLDWEKKVAEVLASPRASDGDNPALLQEIVNLAHLAAQGCALAQGDAGAAALAQLADAKPPNLVERAKIGGGPDGRGFDPRPRPSLDDRAMRSIFERNALQLSRLKTLHPTERKSYFKNVARSADRYPEITAEEGAAIAGYLLFPKSVDEYAEIEKDIPAVLAWKQVRLAIADGLADTTMYPELVQKLLATLLKREIKLPEGNDWRAEFKQEILRQALGELQTSAIGDAPISRGPAWIESGASAYQEYLAAQARLLRANGGALAEANRPGATLRLMVDQAVARMTGQKLRPIDAAYLASLPNQLTAIAAISDNDLQLCAQLQKIWIRLVAAEIVFGAAGRARDVDRVVADFEATERSRTNVLAQLRDGEAALVKLWLIQAGSGWKELP